MPKRLLCIAIFGLLVVGFLAGIGSATEVKPTDVRSEPATAGKYTTHAPIRINSDKDPNWSEFSGRIISSFDINGSGYGYCIYIGNCSKPFTIRDCCFYGASANSAYYYWDSGLILYNSYNGNVDNNTASNNSGNGVYLSFSGNNIIDNNTARNNSGSGIYAEASNNSIIKNNAVKQNPCGIYINSYLGHSISRIEVIGNSCENNEYGIDVYASDNNTIRNNQCIQNTKTGIEINSAKNNTVFNNTCIRNIFYGIYLSTHAKNTLSRNNCSENQGQGIYLSDSNSIIIIRNNCTKNIEAGIMVKRSNNNNILFNSISSNNWEGIDIDPDSKYNSIVGNNLEKNNGADYVYDGSHIQATDYNGLNFWNGTSGQGNYWSDWNYYDNDTNGIVDGPYLIDGGCGARDFYPLAIQVFIPEPSPLPLVICSVLLLTAATVRLRKR